jgi:hypothetical protein
MAFGAADATDAVDVEDSQAATSEGASTCSRAQSSSINRHQRRCP